MIDASARWTSTCSETSQMLYSDPACFVGQWWVKKRLPGPASRVGNSLEELMKHSWCSTRQYFSLSERMGGKRGVSCYQPPTSFIGTFEEWIMAWIPKHWPKYKGYCWKVFWKPKCKDESKGLCSCQGWKRHPGQLYHEAGKKEQVGLY